MKNEEKVLPTSQFYILNSQFFIPSSLPLLVRRVLAADDPDDAAPLDDLAAIAALLD
jgi:hypothetical protein